MAREFAASNAPLNACSADGDANVESEKHRLSWVGCASVLATYSVSSSTAFMPYIYGRLGYVVAPLLQMGYMLLCAALQDKVLQISIRNPDARNMPALGRLLAGRTGERIYQFLQLSNQQLFMPCAMLFVIKSLKQIVLPADVDGYVRPSTIAGILSCNVVWLFLVLGVALFCVNAQRRFGHAAIICKVTCLLNAVQVALILCRVYYNPDDKGPKPVPGVPTHHGLAYPGPARLTFDSAAAGERGYWNDVFLAISSFGYGYVPCFIATEALQEMKVAKDVGKALWSSTVGMFLLYAAVGIGPVLAWGWDRNYEVLTEVQADIYGRGANLMLLLASGMDFVITGISLNQRLQEVVDPSFDPDDWSLKACTKWLSYSLPSLIVSFLMLCFIPDLSTLVGLMTAFVVPFSQIIGPAVLTVLASRQGKLGYSLKLRDWMLIVTGCCVGAVMLVVGGASTVYTIFWKTQITGNFFCDAVAG